MSVPVRYACPEIRHCGPASLAFMSCLFPLIFALDAPLVTSRHFPKIFKTNRTKKGIMGEHYIRAVGLFFQGLYLPVPPVAVPPRERVDLSKRHNAWSCVAVVGQCIDDRNAHAMNVLP